MGSDHKAADIARSMLSWLGLELVSCRELQRLWAGYGHICAIEAKGRLNLANGNDGPAAVPADDSRATHKLILKFVSPPSGLEDEGHLRKVFSYEVEQYFYDEIAPTLQVSPVAQCLASTSKMRDRAIAEGFGDVKATIMTDLRIEYPIAGEKRTVLSEGQVFAALRWLARFHSSYWKSTDRGFKTLILPPLEENTRRKTKGYTAKRDVWLNGGYTYLATRRKEYAALAQDEDSEWSSAFCEPVNGSSDSVAELAAAILTPSGRACEVYLHGDVKSENLFSSKDGDEVAFFDFQYIGVGFGVCDLAKLFTCSVPLRMLIDDCKRIANELSMSDKERSILETYRKELLARSPSPQYPWEEFKRHWETALVDWCRFQASWGFWGNTEWLQARVRSILKDRQWVDWLRSETSK